MMDSLKKLLNKFPFFLDKDHGSNFYKSQSVTNNQFKNISNDLYKVYESFHLNKRCMIWKEQHVPNEYQINFIVNYPNLKRVQCYKNNELIYFEEYTTMNINSFVYVYDGESKSIIPEDIFEVFVETFDEYSIRKGFPENNIAQGDIYDYDDSLDEIGALYNIPRKNYQIVDPESYSLTEPPYNNRLVEDDYHYMNRIIEYIIRLHTTPLPVLELWKLYGIDCEMVNHERFLLKMFDEEKHDKDWSPMLWEHKDKFCDYTPYAGEYFFVYANTLHPLIGSSVILNFRFVDSFVESLKGDYTVKIFFNGEQINPVENISSFKLDSTLFNTSDENIFTVTGYNPQGEEVSSKTLIVLVKGCNTADYYVTLDGDDSNSGTSRTESFASIKKAISKCYKDTNLISLGEGTYNFSKDINVNTTCILLGCPRDQGEIILQNNINTFFNISPGVELTLKNICLSDGTNKHYIDELVLKNSNSNRQSVKLINYIDKGDG